MVKVLTVIVVILSFVLAGLLLYSQFAPKGDSSKKSEDLRGQVSMQDDAISPASLSIKVGTTVLFSNLDTHDHSLKAEGGEFITGTITAGKTYTHTFETPGTYAYHCTMHPEMTGTIVVTE